MKNIATPVAQVKVLDGINVREQGRTVRPSEKTLAFLRLFARNYRVEKRLPEGLQGLVLG